MSACIKRMPLLLSLIVMASVMGGCAKKAGTANAVTGQDSLVKNQKAADVADNYPEPWKTDFRPRLHQILMENDVKDCKEPQHRLHSSGRSYLVKCGSDLYYIAWLGQGVVGGPYQKRKGSFIKGDERRAGKQGKKSSSKAAVKENSSASLENWDRSPMAIRSADKDKKEGKR